MRPPGMRPLRCWVLVKLDDRATSYDGGGLILTHDLSYNQPETAEVLAVGPGTRESPMECVVGERVLLGKYNGKPVNPLLVDPNENPHSDRYWLLDTDITKVVPDVYGIEEDS